MNSFLNKVLLIAAIIVSVLIYNKLTIYFNNVNDFDAGYNIELSVQQMLQDVSQLKKLIQNNHPLYKSDPSAINKIFNDIETSINGNKSLSEFSRILATNIAKMNDGHTCVELVNGNLTLPIITKNINNEYFSLTKFKTIKAGDRIISIGGTPLDSIYQSYSEQISSENEYWKRESFEHYFIDIGRIIELGGKTTFFGDIKIKFESNGQTYKTYVQKKELITEQYNRDIRNKILYGDSENNSGNGVRLEFCESNSYARLILRNCEYTSYYSMKVDELFKGVNGKGIRNIILDLRGNQGGTTQVIDYFKTRLDAFNRYLSRKNEENVYFVVLVDNCTFSGGAHFAGVMKYDYEAILIGQPTGDSLYGYGNIKVGQLNNSTLYYSVSSTKFNGYGDISVYSDSIYPDIITNYKPLDYVLNNDVDLSIAEKIILIREELKK